MKPTDWKGVAELIGILAIVGSLVFVGFQLRQDRDIAIAEIYTNYGDSHTQWVVLLIQQIDIWKRGLDGDELADEQLAKFDALALGYEVLQRTKYNRSLSLVGPTQDVPIQMANFIFQHDGLSVWWQRRMEYQDRRRVRGPFRDAIDEHLNALRDGSIEPVFMESYIPNN